MNHDLHWVRRGDYMIVCAIEGVYDLDYEFLIDTEEGAYSYSFYGWKEYTGRIPDVEIDELFEHTSVTRYLWIRGDDDITPN